MLKNSPPFMKALAVFTAVILLSYIFQIYYNRINNDFVTFYKRPMITDTDGQMRSSYSGGDAVVIHFYVERSSNRCFADYYQLLNGPVSTQFSAARSQIITNTLVRAEVPYMVNLPHGLPDGDYKWSQLVYPTCGGEEQPPYMIDIGRITIKN